MSDLYHPVRIGCLDLAGNLFLAPIAGYSDRAFRALCIEQGAAYCTTEMVSAEALVRGSAKTESLMVPAQNETAYAVQLFGGNADVMERAARIVLEKNPLCTSIDINAGCPVQKIVKSGAGSMLTRNPELLFAIVKAANDGAKSYAREHGKNAVPVTVKIRSGWDLSHLTWKECTQAAIEAGAAALTIHARTRAQGYEGKADWELQRNLVDFVAKKIPVFGSGDAHTPELAKKMIEETGVDGVMFARGAMGDPFIFRRTIELFKTGSYQKESPAERIAAGFKELSLNVQYNGEKTACLQMRKKFCAYSSGLQGGAKVRVQIVQAQSVQDYKNIFAPFICKGHSERGCEQPISASVNRDSDIRQNDDC